MRGTAQQAVVLFYSISLRGHCNINSLVLTGRIDDSLPHLEGVGRLVLTLVQYIPDVKVLTDVVYIVGIDIRPIIAYHV